MSWTRFANPQITQKQREAVMQAALNLLEAQRPDVRDRARLEAAARQAVARAAQETGVYLPPVLQAALVQDLVGRVGGLGFLQKLLDSGQYAEIALNPDGTVWVLPKGERFFQPYDYAPTREEVARIVEALSIAVGKQLSEATPSIDARLPRRDGGARVKILHPVLLPGGDFPSINIRLFEARPVPPEQIVAWDMAPEWLMQQLLEWVARGKRFLIVGETYVGKTTFLSALCHGIPRHARIVKIEDPEEIYLPHPNVVTIEARPAPPGSQVPTYTLADGVDDAMRMRPDWLIVGEMRRGHHVMSLFRAQMSGHPGLSTLHAFGPESAVERMETLVYTDLGIGRQGTKAMIVHALDFLIHLGWEGEKRRVLGIWEIGPALKGGDVPFHRIYECGMERLEPLKWEKNHG